MQCCSTTWSVVNWMGIPSLPALILKFLYEQQNPGLTVPIEDIPLSECLSYTGKVYTYPSAIARFHAPSNKSGLGGMLWEWLWSVPRWHGGAERCDYVFIAQDEDLPGFHGLLVRQVLGFIKLTHEGITYPAAVISWFEMIGTHPCPQMNMWKVRHDLGANGQWQLKIVHLDTIVQGVHLISIAGSAYIPYELDYTNSLDAFKAFYVNIFIDYHAHEIAI